MQRYCYAGWQINSLQGDQRLMAKWSLKALKYIAAINWILYHYTENMLKREKKHIWYILRLLLIIGFPILTSL